jgi:hypothetical protein
MPRRSRIERILTLVSQFGNVVLFDGHPDETISGRAYRQGHLLGDPVWRDRMHCINRRFRDPDHCRDSHQLDIDFASEILALVPERTTR